MKNILIAKTALERLATELSRHKNVLTIYTLEMNGDITLGDEVVQTAGSIDYEALNIQLGWLSRDLIIGDYAKVYLTTLLKSPKLEWMQSLSAGLDTPIFAMLAAKGIRLCNSDAQAPAIAEYVIASVMYRYQNFNLRKEYQLNKQWQYNEFREVANSNWMIVGLGNIGQRVGRAIRSMSGNVTGVKRSDKQPTKDADKLITYEALFDALPEQDVVVLSCALTDATKGIVNAAFLEKMKPNSIIVNIGRGALIDEAALLSSLDDGKLDYAVLDVFETEPLDLDSPFWLHEKVLMTPHSSNRGDGTNLRGDRLFLYNLNAILHGTELTNEVDTSTLL